MRLKADTFRVVLSKEVSRLELFDLKELRKVVLNWPYSAHVSYQR